MDDNLKRIKQEFEEHKGQLVITESWNVERLIAIGTDDTDYYYVTYNGRKTVWNTCVGRIIPLKNKIDQRHYESFIRTARLNHFDQEDLWGRPVTEERKIEIQQHKAEIMSLNDPDKFLTEVCWDLN